MIAQWNTDFTPLKGIDMKQLLVPLCVALVFAVSAFAQSKGEADPAQSKAIPVEKATAEQKAAAKAGRKATGKSIAKAKTTEADADPSPAGVAKKATKEERLAAAKARKAAAAEALKKGQISSGEK